MFQSEEKIRKEIITEDGTAEFQIRFIRDDNVGVLTTRSGKSFLILDSIDYWYDLIQEKYPSKQKCRCKNDCFKLYFDYIPRLGTDDYRMIELYSCCTECGKQRMFAAVDIDYSPTTQLFEQPITYCEQPKIKYEVYSKGGYWKEEQFYQLIEFLTQKQLLIYCWYWELQEKRRYVCKFTAEELKEFFFEKRHKYLNIYFSLEPLDELLVDESPADEKGVYVARDIWRKGEIIKINHPMLVAAVGAGNYYSMDFCSQYIERGEVKDKSEAFRQCAQDLKAFCREKLN